MSVRLRAHHLLCILTFVGEGYTPAFVENLAAVVARVRGGEPVELVDGPDDVCAPLENSEDQHCFLPSARNRDRDALRSIAAEGSLDLAGAPAVRLDAAAIRTLRARFAAGTIRDACTGCPWSETCTNVAGAAYAGAHL